MEPDSTTAELVAKVEPALATFTATRQLEA